jgi:very-short-patch-repair endonuclease
MRKELTPAELLLWSKIRGDQLGHRFRRQHLIGNFIADFYCRELRLVIEVDGDSHDERREYDEKRTHWMEIERGLRVLRFTNDDVLKNLDSVLEAILHLGSSATHPSPPPSPPWGEGGSEL